MPTSPATQTLAFVGDLSWSDVPARVQDHLGLLLADLAAVCVAGRPAPAARMAAEYASAVHPGDEAVALLDGRRLGAVGAAWANGVLANVLDFDDGHRLTKGHPGAIVIPAALAVAQQVDATAQELRAAVLVGYEIAIRAGIALHARSAGYHASGAWGAVGAAAAAARLLGLGAAATAHAIGLAEYHAPIALIMRSVAEPAMTKDACAWGASVGVSAALMAKGGFTATRAEYLETADAGDLGATWRVEELYLKAYPCCRWGQGAIRAALEAGGGHALAPDDVERIEIRTFAAADALAKVAPSTTEEAQYNLIWPVATVVVRGAFTVADVLGPWDAPDIAALAARTVVRVDDALTAAFPARRLTAVDLLLRDGRTLAAGPLEARGEPGEPGWLEVVDEKVRAHVDPSRDLAAVGPPTLRDADPAQLLGLMCAPILTPVDA
jgi:2-methylcitrate dehydratase PrpD